jgi:glycosyltransferase involved in cell wall biosynthesis
MKMTARYKHLYLKFVNLIAVIFIISANLFCSAVGDLQNDLQNENSSLNPKVAVIIPVYKTEKYLKECLDSVINQTFKDIAVICVNDASPDNSQKILDEYAKKDKRIKVLKHEKNKGLSAARNTGINFVLSSNLDKNVEYFGFVDSDDCIEPELYEISYKEAKKDNVDILHFGRNYITKNNKRRGRIMPGYILESGNNLLALNEKITRNAWDKIFKKEIFKKDKFADGFIAEDYCFLFTVLPKVKRIKRIPYTLYNYRTDNLDSITHLNNKKKFLEMDFKIIKYVCDSWRKNKLLASENKKFILETFIQHIHSKKDMSIIKDFTEKLINAYGSDVFNEKEIEKCSKKTCRNIFELTNGKFGFN